MSERRMSGGSKMEKKIGKLKIFVVMEEEFASVRKEQEVCYLVGNKTFLGEAFLIMTSVVGVQQQQEVLAWLLELLLTQWTQQDWQNAYLSDPYGCVRLCADIPLMWSIFHTGKNEANYGTYNMHI